MRHVSFLILLAALLASCAGRQTRVSQEAGDTVAFKYATRLSVVKSTDYTVASIKNPWKEGHLLHQYVLVPDTVDIETLRLRCQLPEGTLVRTPLRRPVIFTTVHCAMLMTFGLESRIAGVADLQYIKIPWIQEQVSRGRIADVGEGLSPVVEKVIDLRPDAILLSPFENSGGYGKLEDISIPLIECAEYMEPSPLARAEWLRFYGMLFGCEHTADSLFHAVDSSYNALKALAATASQTPEVLVDKITGNVWYVPGGQSTIGRMVSDAGGRYPWAADAHSGSVSLPFEAVLEKAGEADVWLFRYSADHDITRPELLSEHRGYSQFRAFRDGRVYGCDVGRSTFYEESPFRPDWLLNDFIRILHPEIEGLHPLRYYKQL